jgi:anti-sigma factor ChrR (cupin superfamily)
MFKAAPGCQVPMHGHPAGEEVFVLDGALTDENYSCGAGAWVRNPVGSAHSVISEPGALAYVKTGGFPNA